MASTACDFIRWIWVMMMKNEESVDSRIVVARPAAAAAASDVHVTIVTALLGAVVPDIGAAVVLGTIIPCLRGAVILGAVVKDGEGAGGRGQQKNSHETHGG